VIAVGLTGERHGDATPPLGLAVATAACITAYLMIDGLGVRRSGSPFGYLVFLTGLEGLLFVVGAAMVEGRAVIAAAWDRRGLGLLTGVIATGGYGIALWAFDRAPVAAVAALRETSVLFGALIAFVWLKERFGPWRVAGALLVMAGAILLRLA
jgi:drug/metabolite transporter (DMT)-like permease